MDLWSSVIDAGYERALRPAMFRIGKGDPEVAHERMIGILATTPTTVFRASQRILGRPDHPTTVAGITFPGRVGVAAGLDKDGRAAHAWAGFGFGFAELGTVTAHAQPGNQKPRVFRAVESRGLVNRMGFNNHGAAALADRLAMAGVQRGNNAVGIPLGISLGKTRSTPLEEATADYLASFEALAPHADYIAINVSSPNTPGLRQLQDADALADLVRTLVQAAATQPVSPLPIFVKVAPDLTFDQLDEVVGVCETHGASGLIATNTTLSREGLAASDQGLVSEAGGLSGAPLTRRAREVVSHLASRTSLPVMGVGGIMTADDARAMFDAGAVLVQLYTGFIYSGPALVRAINSL
ncbi:MAG TPA: quinone-dependent dihydroorotate dehydrogenase [Propionibacteriaceae bacterium]|nr:quinone-dependent dihydroorotate dehydrogenase [Propionibacteriaceae bacterium]